MCDHSVIEYLGSQERSNGDSFPLYNCLKCHSTITLHESELTGSATQLSSKRLLRKDGYYSELSISKLN